LIGFTDKRGHAWHYRPEEQGDEPNHYPGAIPLDRPTAEYLLSVVASGAGFYRARSARGTSPATTPRPTRIATSTVSVTAESPPQP
jgi:hypothetical protein